MELAAKRAQNAGLDSTKGRAGRRGLAKRYSGGRASRVDARGGRSGGIEVFVGRLDGPASLRRVPQKRRQVPIETKAGLRITPVARGPCT